MSKKFLRTDYMRLSKLGKNRKKLQVWRRARGMHSKIRRRRRGYPEMPLIGRRKPSKDIGKIKGLTPILVHNVKELNKADKNSIIIIARVGARKKLDILKVAEQTNLKIFNVGGKDEAK